jgi:hypothetical protein
MDLWWLVRILNGHVVRLTHEELKPLSEECRQRRSEAKENPDNTPILRLELQKLENSEFIRIFGAIIPCVIYLHDLAEKHISAPGFVTF